MRIIPKPWGEERIFVENEKYVFKHLVIKEGHRISLQYHNTKDETYMVKSGIAQLEMINDGCVKIKNIDSRCEPVRIKSGVVHRLTGITNVIMQEVSTGEQYDIVRIEDDYGRVDNVKVA
jgi:mannose-6-phosphate isomerase